MLVKGGGSHEGMKKEKCVAILTGGGACLWRDLMCSTSIVKHIVKKKKKKNWSSLCNLN